MLLLSLHTQQQLTLAERQSAQWRLAESLPVGGWLLAPRYRFDVQMGYLQRYQRTRDARWLEAVRRWAPDYVRVHPDPNVSFTQILLALQQRDLPEVHRLATRFYLTYPNDRRIPWLQDARRPFNQKWNDMNRFSEQTRHVPELPRNAELLRITGIRLQRIHF